MTLGVDLKVVLGDDGIFMLGVMQKVTDTVIVEEELKVVVGDDVIVMLVVGHAANGR